MSRASSEPQHGQACHDTPSYTGAVTGTTCCPETMAETFSNKWGFPEKTPVAALKVCSPFPDTHHAGGEGAEPISRSADHLSGDTRRVKQVL